VTRPDQELPDLWEKVDGRAQRTTQAMMRSKTVAPLKGKQHLPAEAEDFVNRCSICDELIKEEFWSRAHAYLSKKTRFTEAKKLVPVHEKCIATGAALAVTQGYDLRVEDEHG
jgi:hypothetical protein